MNHLMFVTEQTDLSRVLTGSYDLRLVTLSLFIAVAGSFAAFEVLERVKNAESIRQKVFWLLAGGVSMGSGVWAMHFIGMLAFNLPIPVNYDVVVTELSVLPAVFAGTVMLFVFADKNPKVRATRVLIGGVLMGAGIGAMHFIGMEAMQMDAHMYYAPVPFAVAVGVAVTLAVSALYLRHRAETMPSSAVSRRMRQASPLVMGLAVAGMHYTAMRSIYFVPYGAEQGEINGLDPHYLSIWIGVVTIGILVLINLSSAVGKRIEAASRLREEINERRKAEKLLRESEANFRAIIANTTEGVITIDGAGNIETVNPVAQNMFGYGSNEMHGRPVLDLLPPEEHDRYTDYIASFERRVSRYARAPWECLGLKKSADVFPLEVNVGMMQVWGERKFVAVVRDITARKEADRKLANHQHELERQVQERTEHLVAEANHRKEAESALRESQEKISAIMENLITGVVVIDPDGKISFSNDAADRMLSSSGQNGDSPVKITGRPFQDVFSLSEDDCSEGIKSSLIGRVAINGETLRADDKAIILADGTSISISYGCSPLIVGGKPSGAILSLRDIRELKFAQAEAAQAQRHASVGQLAAGIAHEINTPAQYIGTNLQFLQEAHEDVKRVLESVKSLLQAAKAGQQSIESEIRQTEEALEDADLDYLLEEIPAALQQSIDGVAQVSNIVLAMKEFSHPGTKKKEPTDLNHNIENTLTVCKNEWKHLASVKLDLDPDLPPVPCLAGEINQVILNLIVNSAHAIDAAQSGTNGEITISSRANGDWAELRIADTGVGIPKDIQQKVFDPFFTTKEVGKGTGQGLAITRDVIVEKHGGKIDLKSEPGHGTEFIIQLPLSE